jgi:hypothetical protein
MKTLTLKIEQQGGEYHGYASISNIPDEIKITKGSKEICLGDIKIKFDELIDIVGIENSKEDNPDKPW